MKKTREYLLKKDKWIEIVCLGVVVLFFLELILAKVFDFNIDKTQIMFDAICILLILIYFKISNIFDYIKGEDNNASTK